MQWEFEDEVWHQKTRISRIMGLPCGEEIVITGVTMWTQSTSECDRRMDGRTHRFTITKTALCIALRCKNSLQQTIVY